MHGVTGTFDEQDTPASGWEAQVGVSLGGQPGAPPASRDSGSCPVPLPLGPGITCDPGMEPYPVALCGDVLCAVRDLRLAAVQDAPDDGNAGHLLPAADQVLWLLKGHYPAGCRGPGQQSGGLGLGPFSTPTLPPAQPSPDSRSLLIALAPTHSLGRAEEGDGKFLQKKLRGWNSVEQTSQRDRGREKRPGGGAA